MFCSSNETSSGGGMVVWADKGFTLCFFDTVTTSILFGFIFIFGTIQYIFFKYKYLYKLIKIHYFFLIDDLDLESNVNMSMRQFYILFKLY